MPDPDPLSRRPSGSGWRRLLAVLLVLLILAMAGTGVAIWSLQQWARHSFQDEANAIADGFRKTFQFTPEIRARATVLVAQSSPKLEFVTAERTATIRYDWEQSWMGSTKSFEIEANFTAKAGFDLRKPFVIRLDSKNGATAADLPPPQIVSFGMGNVHVLRDEDGLWNKLTEDDRAEAFRELENKARQDFQNSDLLARAQAEANDRIHDILSGRPIPSPTPFP